MKRVEKFLRQDTLSGLRRHAFVRRGKSSQTAGHLPGRSLPDVPCPIWLYGWTAYRILFLRRCVPWRSASVNPFRRSARRLLDLGLGYLALDRASSTLSTGERQRMQLARAVRNRTTGVLYVLDEPSIGLHPSNIIGLTGVMHDLIDDGNSIVLVDHDTQVLAEADWIIEMGRAQARKAGR